MRLLIVFACAFGIMGCGARESLTSAEADNSSIAKSTNSLSIGGDHASARVTAVAGSTLQHCALLDDRHVECWGDNDFGQQGDGTTTTSSSRVRVSGITNAISIAVSYSSSLAVTADGSVYAWGGMNTASLAMAHNHRTFPPAFLLGCEPNACNGKLMVEPSRHQ